MVALIIIAVILGFTAVGEYMYFSKKVADLENEIRELKYKHNVK